MWSREIVCRRRTWHLISVGWAHRGRGGKVRFSRCATVCHNSGKSRGTLGTGSQPTRRGASPARKVGFDRDLCSPATAACPIKQPRRTPTSQATLPPPRVSDHRNPIIACHFVLLFQPWHTSDTISRIPRLALPRVLHREFADE